MDHNSPTYSNCYSGTGCDLASYPHALYQTDSTICNPPVTTCTVTVATTTFSANNYVFLINGDLDIKGNITVSVGSTVTFIVSGNIKVESLIPAQEVTTIEGIYSTDKDLQILVDQNACTDGNTNQALNINGSVTILGTSQFDSSTNLSNRELCANDTTNPSVKITARPDFLINLP